MSSSKLLEQAIVDAQALRDAAFKSAQAALMEKYAPQIKEAVSQLLEAEPNKQEEEPDATPDANTPNPTDALAGGESNKDLATFAAGTDFGGSAESPTGKGVVVGSANDLPLAAVGGQKLCPCPDDNEPVNIELDLDSLADDLRDEEDEEEASTDAMMGGGQQMNPSQQLEEELELENVELDETVELELENSLFESDELEEALEEELEEQELEEDIEEGKKKPKNPLASAAKAQGTTPENLKAQKQTDREALEKKREQNKKEAAERRAAGQTRKEINESKHIHQTKELIKASSVLLKEVENKDTQIQKLLEENNKLTSTVEDMSQAFKKLEEVNTLNARLFYQNQVLKSASLNERQKTHIVEAISKADSVNEAKAVYETLINSMGGPAEKERSPKSLNEAINKKSSFRLPHKQAEQLHDPNKDRWLKLAGIK